MTAEQLALANAVAAQLNLEATPGYDNHWSRIFSLTDGGRLYISNGKGRGQLHISASVPDHLCDHRAYYRDGQAPKTSINVSDKKNAQQIAADIKRRLFPEHERELADCQASKKRHDEFNEKRMLALTQVAAPFGENVKCDERTGEPRPLSIDREGMFRLQAKPYSQSLKVEIETSPEVAGKIAALLANL